MAMVMICCGSWRWESRLPKLRGIYLCDCASLRNSRMFIASAWLCTVTLLLCVSAVWF